MEDLEPGTIDTDTDGMADPRVQQTGWEVGVRKNWGNVVTSLKMRSKFLALVIGVATPQRIRILRH